MSAPAFTPEELQYYASLDLADPDDAALQEFLRTEPTRAAPSPQESVPTKLADDVNAASSHTSSSSSSGAAGAAPVQDAALRRRLSTSGLTRTTAVSALARTSANATDSPSNPRGSSGSSSSRVVGDRVPASTSTTAKVPYAARLSRCGVTDVLDKTDLVGGVAGMADAALQTKVVDLPGRQLTSTASIQCFLNVTHVYLQHNDIRSLDGVELLSELQVLVVHHNALRSVAPLQALTRLFYLDVGFNQLASLSTLLAVELPCTTLQYLNLKGNPLCPSESTADGGSAYVRRVQAACAALQYLDDLKVADTSSSEEEEEEGEKKTEAGKEKRIEEAAISKEKVEEKRDTLLNSSNTTAAVAPARAPASSSGTRRVKSLVEASRTAAAGGALADTRTSTDKGSGAHRPATSPAQLPQDTTSGENSVHRSPSALSSSHLSKHATPLEQEEERLLRQLLLLQTSRSTLSSGGTQGDTAVTSDAAEALTQPATNNGGDEENKEDDVAVVSAVVNEGVGRATDALQLFQGLQYTQEVSQARQQRQLAAHWDDVSRVLQTAQGLQQDRRRRMHERLQASTPAYADVLQLLKRESYTIDLDHYRSAGGPPPQEQEKKVTTAASFSSASTTSAAPAAKTAAAAPTIANATALSEKSSQKAPIKKSPSATSTATFAAAGGVASTAKSSTVKTTKKNTGDNKEPKGPSRVPKPPPPRR